MTGTANPDAPEPNPDVQPESGTTQNNSTIDPESLGGRIWLLIVDKLILGAAIGLAIAAYNESNTEKAVAREEARQSADDAFRRASYVKELVPVVLDTSTSVAVRMHYLGALIETRSVSAQAALDLTARLLLSDALGSPGRTAGVRDTGLYSVRYQVDTASFEWSYLQNQVSALMPRNVAYLVTEFVRAADMHASAQNASWELLLFYPGGTGIVTTSAGGTLRSFAIRPRIGFERWPYPTDTVRDDRFAKSSERQWKLAASEHFWATAIHQVVQTAGDSGIAALDSMVILQSDGVSAAQSLSLHVNAQTARQWIDRKNRLLQITAAFALLNGVSDSNAVGVLARLLKDDARSPTSYMSAGILAGLSQNRFKYPLLARVAASIVSERSLPPRYFRDPRVFCNERKEMNARANLSGRDPRLFAAIQYLRCADVVGPDPDAERDLLWHSLTKEVVQSLESTRHLLDQFPADSVSPNLLGGVESIAVLRAGDPFVAGPPLTSEEREAFARLLAVGHDKLSRARLTDMVQAWQRISR